MNIKDLIKNTKTPVFLEDFSSEEDIIEKFELNASDLRGCKILLAVYDREWYSGDAFVLFTKAGELYEVNGSHCSCYGLEDQWDPEHTSIEALLHRINKGTLGGSSFKKELLALLQP